MVLDLFDQAKRAHRRVLGGSWSLSG